MGEKQMEEEVDCPYVDCAHCGRKLWHTHALPVEKWFGEIVGMKTLHFCGEEEANEYFLELLRKGEE